MTRRTRLRPRRGGRAGARAGLHRAARAEPEDDDRPERLH